MSKPRKISNQQIIDFCVSAGRWPRQLSPDEGPFRNAIQARLNERDLMDKIEEFRKVNKRGPKPKWDDITLGIQLMDSGGDGFF